MPSNVAEVPVAQVLQDLSLEASTLRFYQVQFREHLKTARPGHFQRGLLPADIDTLRVIHFLMHIRGLSTAEAQAYLRKRVRTKDVLVSEGVTEHAPAAGPRPKTKTYGKVIAFTSGKGGVGKTNIALNVAVELGRLGFRTALVDADLGLANVHILANLTPRATLEDVVAGRATIREALTTGPRGISVLSGASGLLDLAELGARDRARLMEQLEQLEAEHDVVLLDTGAGLSHQVLDFIACADEAIVVTTPEATAIADAYAMVKVLAQRQENLPVRILVNRAASAYEADVVVRRLMRCAEQFLETSLGEVGHVLDDAVVPQAVRQRTPFVISQPRSRAAKSIRRVAEQLVAVELRRGTSGGPRATLTRWLDVMRPAVAVPSAPILEA